MVDWSQLSSGTAQTCSGGAQYTYYNANCPTKNEADPSCGINWVAVNTVNTCRYPDYTLGAFWDSGTRKSHNERVCDRPPGALKPICTIDKVYDQTCAQLMAVWQASDRVSSAYLGGVNNGTQYGSNITLDSLKDNLDGTCTWLAHNVPHIVSGPNIAVCGQTTTWQQQGYLTCAVAQPKTCGETTSYVPAGDGYAQIPGHSDINGSVDDTEPSKNACLTAENIAIPATDAPGGAVDQKFGKLAQNLATANAGGFSGTDTKSVAVNDGDIAGAIVRQMKLLFELDGDKMNPADQAAAVQTYLTYPGPADNNSCGANYAPPSTASCDPANQATVASVNAMMEFCTRMTSVHVQPAVQNLPAVAAVCIDQLPAAIGKLRASLLAGGFDDGTQYAASAPPVGGVAADGGGEAGITDAGADAADAGPQYPDPNDVCGFKTYRAQFDALVSRPLESRFLAPRNPTNTADQAELVTRMQLLDRWYKQLAKNLWPYNAGEPYAKSVRAAAWQHATDAEGAFWTGVYDNSFSGLVKATDAGPITGSPDSSVDAAIPPVTMTADQLAALVQDTLAADRAVLSMIFPYDATAATQANPPLSSAPLLLLAGDALEGMSQRMHAVGIYHDMGCTYARCGSADPRSELVWLMDLLTALPDAGVLRTTVANAAAALDQNSQPVVGTEWMSVYRGILNQHGALESAVANSVWADSSWNYTTSGAPLLSAGSAGQVSLPAQHLAGLVQSARAASQNYDAIGLFNASPRDRLPAGMSQDTVDGIRSDVQTRASQLDSARTSFDTNLAAIANGVIQEMNAKTGMLNSLDTIKEKAADFDNEMANFDGLRATYAVNDTDLGNFVAAYAGLAAFDSNALITGKSYGPWDMTARSVTASGPITTNSDISTMAIPNANALGLTKGSIVTIQTGAADKWAPVCAIHQQKVMSAPDNATPYPLTLHGSLTGPEGFMATITNDQESVIANTTAHSDATSKNISVEAKACAGFHAEGGPDFFGQEAKIYVDISACTSGGIGRTWTDTSSNSQTDNNDAKASLTLTSGLRLPNAPFPDAPVGSLLAVITDKGKPTSWRDVRVVQAPATSIVLDADSDIYLLANDTTGCDATALDTSDALHVSITTAEHAGDALAWVKTGLGNVSAYLAGLGAGDPSTGTFPPGSLVAQGVLTPDQATSIRSTANELFLASCNGGLSGTPTGGSAPSDTSLCDLTKLPDPVHEFYTSLVDREITQLELKIQILQSLRALNGLGLSYQQLIDDYNAAFSQAAVAELIPRWALRNLDVDQLQDETAALVNAATYELYPVLQLRYPDVFAQGLEKDKDLQNDMRALINAQWDAPADQLAKAAVSAATELYNATASLAVTYPPVTPKVLALSFPRPGKPSHTWQTVSDGRALQVWNQATNTNGTDKNGTHKAQFQILPEDLYNLAGGLPSLRCTEQVPVIRDFAVVLSGSRFNNGNDEATFTAKPITVASSSQTSMQFPRAMLLDSNQNVFWQGANLTFNLAQADWASMDTQILVSTDPTNAIAKYNARTTPAGVPGTTYFVNGKGLSPFDTFTIDFSGLYNATNFPNLPVDEADLITVVMTLDYREVDGSRSMTFLTPCAGAQQ
jgi:hypothetical protein